MVEDAPSLFDRRQARRMARHRRQLGYVYAAAGIALAILAVIFAFALGSAQGTEWRLAARWTARVSFLLFVVLFVCAAIAPVSEDHRTDGKLRTALRAFAGSHLVHLVALSLYLLHGGSTGLVTIIGGSLGYGVILALLLATSVSTGDILGKRRRLLIGAGLWYLWLMFAATYAGRFARGEGTAFHAAALVVLAGLALFWLVRRWPRHHPGTVERMPE